MITFNTTIAPPSSSNFVDVADIPASGEIVALCNTNGSLFLQVYSASTGAPVGAEGSVTGTMNTTAVISMIDGTHAAILDSSGHCQVIDVSSMIVQWSGTASSNNTTPQSFVGNSNSNSALGCPQGGSAGWLNLVNNANSTASNFFGYAPWGQNFTCVIAKPGSSNFILGCADSGYKACGFISEYDANFMMVRSYSLPAPLNHTPQNNSLYPRHVSQIAYYSGYLIALTSWGELILFDHESGKQLQQYNLPQTTGTPGIWMSPATNGTVFLMESGSGFSGGHMRRLMEFDFVRTPIIQEDMQYVPGTDAQYPNIIKPGCQPGAAWVATQNAGIHLYTWTPPRTLTSKSVAYVDGSSNPVAGECVVLDDTVSPAQVMFATSVPESGKTIPITAGKTGNGVLLLHSYGKGVRRQFYTQRMTT